eukprot:CAMPEP_0172726666 /NCGR_PEP_ID=MMETSP1074-20121228/91239_1 /TAXON_ID=2916 /ORGANISM="Ceratium fusus, Strain PA161109" /LENGTH=544 /DNA_ID=CAMNT_0013553751 /DNA_START=306 /DNA_END=1940 /DNA_ORIENTATION=-
MKQADVIKSEIVQQAVAIPCAARGASCFQSKCCQETGMQCYSKSGTWATCLPNCTSGLHPTDTDPTRWNCEPLGARTAGLPPMDYYGGLKPAAWVAAKCSANGANCFGTGCCKEPGMTCFAKDEDWASCKPSCQPGPDPTDRDPSPWSCVPLGNPTPGAVTPFYWKDMAVAPWVANKCSAIGANCMSTKCCAQPGHTCFKKDDKWAMCKAWCAPGPDLWDSDPKPWDCTPLGSRTPGEPQPPGPLASWVNTRCTAGTGSCLTSQCCKDPGMQCYQKNDVHAACQRSCFKGVHGNDPDKSPWTCKTLGQRMPGNWPSPSFFCWVLTRSVGDEANLVRVQLVNHWGIFQCEEWSVFSDIAMDLGMGEQSIPIGDLTAQKGQWGSWLNTVVFAKAWHAIHDSGQYLNHDWIVKADPDAAFFLDRLKANLAPVPLNQPWAIHNSNTATPMLGPMEVLNKAALIIYYANNPPHLSGTDKAVCENAYMAFSGEDGFLSGCLQKLGVPAVYHKHLLFNHIPVKCTNPAYVTFHPAKTEAEFRRCVQEVQAR